MRVLQRTRAEELTVFVPFTTVCFLLVCLLNTDEKTLAPVTCKSGQPCSYPEQVDLRIIVITYDRPDSLQVCLDALQELQVAGDSAILEIWIDVNHQGELDNATYMVASHFRWRVGPVRVHVHSEKAGLLGQWIKTWSPLPYETVIFVEDDVDLSPFAYKWIKAVRENYGDESNLCGTTLQDEYILVASGRARGTSLQRSKDDLLFLHQIPGSWGFSPFPRCWHEFQKWYHTVSQDAGFLPYLPEAGLYDKWYHDMVAEGRKDTMWIMWFIHFMFHENYKVVHSNLPAYTGVQNASLAVHRKENGLHFQGRETIQSKEQMLSHWSDKYTSFPRKVKSYTFDGSFEEQKKQAD